MPPTPYRHRPVLGPVVGQHGENVAALWRLRDAAVEAPHFGVAQLQRLDERLAGHVDGLQVAGEAAWPMLLTQLRRFPEAGELFAAAVLAFETADGGRIAEVLDVAEAMPETLAGLEGAIEWCAPRKLAPTIRWFEASNRPLERYLAVVACSVHRSSPGQRHLSLLNDAEPRVRARAMRLAGELGRVELLEAVLRSTDDTDPTAAAWAAWSAVLLGDRGVALPPLEALAEAVEGRGGTGERPSGRPAVELVCRAMGLERAARWLRPLSGDPAHRRTVTMALAHVGEPASVPWLIGRMADPTLARLAGESFSLITGVDLAYDDLEGEAPGDFEEGSADESSDHDVDLDADENLPWPDPDLVQGWWEGNGSRFERGVRYLLGRPIDAHACDEAWVRGFQRQRRAAAYELGLMRGDSPLRNWRARTLRR